MAEKSAPVVQKPFHTKEGKINFHINALGGVMFILPDPKWTAEKLGNIIIPETVKARKAVGTVLSCGPGITNTRTKKFEYGVPTGTRVYFEDSVPWNYECEDRNEGPNLGKTFNLVMCSIVDVCATEEEG